jgi:hypothetical protein
MNDEVLSMITKSEQTPSKQKPFMAMCRFLWAPVMEAFLRFDRRMDGAASFFVKHWGKSRFMVAMSKKAQYMGLEKLFLKGPKAFLYFFLFYLIRDTILYIILPIWFASLID